MCYIGLLNYKNTNFFLIIIMKYMCINFCVYSVVFIKNLVTQNNILFTTKINKSIIAKVKISLS